MQASLVNESGQLVVDLHRALSEIDPARWHAGAAEAYRAKLAEIQKRLTTLTSRSWPEAAGALEAKLCELRRTLAAQLPDDAAGSTRRRWMTFRRSMVPAYESLSAALSAYEIHVPSLRPTNLKRSVVHVASASVAVAVLYFMPDRWWAVAIAVPVVLAAWTTEKLRRTRPRLNAAVMRVFAPIAHAHEYRRVNSATWYVTALAILSLTVAPLYAAIGLAALGLGDPAAGFIGRRFGRIRLLHGRTLEGTASFAVSATLAGTLVALAFAPGLTLGAALTLGVCGGVAGAIAELLSFRVDDNLSVPLAGAAAAALAGLLLGLPLG